MSRARDHGNGRVYVEGTIVEAREAYEQDQQSRRALGAVVAVVIVAVFVALALRRMMSHGASA